MKHRLLERQLKKLGLTDQRQPPNAEVWQRFLERISRAYTAADQDRYLIERSLSISSRVTRGSSERVRPSRRFRRHST